jgi:hypothetical protein
MIANKLLLLLVSVGLTMGCTTHVSTPAAVQPSHTPSPSTPLYLPTQMGNPMETVHPTEGSQTLDGQAIPSTSLPVEHRPSPTVLAETSTPLPTLDPSAATVPQLIDDLAARLGVPESEIVFQGLWLVEDLAESLDCSPHLGSEFVLEYVMIVTEDGERYERPVKVFKLDEDGAMGVLLLAGETPYLYYVVGDRFLFCPAE